MAEVLILGGGPAGCAVAIGLQRLGYDVCLVSQTRPFASLEGVSERVIQGMKSAGFDHALTTLAPPSPRRVTWNGVTSAANTECLIERQAFDAALLDDAQAAGVQVVRGRVSAHAYDGRQWQATAENADGEQQLYGRFLVEARGRAAPSAGRSRVRSAETIALLLRRRGQPGRAASAVESFADGWAWLAQQADGTRYLQLALDVAQTRLPAKEQLSDWCLQRLQQLPQAQPFLQETVADGQVYARSSTQILLQDLLGDHWLRVGDAAMAVDPLSGNGIFQSLSSALQAPAVINTLLRKPGNKALAAQFYQARVEGLFYRFARTGRDFCRQEQQWPLSEFWRSRCHWPDDEPLHITTQPHEVEIAQRPVIDQHLIEQATVVVTPDQPLGIWHVNGIELAPVLQRLRASSAPAAETLTQQFGASRGRQLTQWLQQQGLIPA